MKIGGKKTLSKENCFITVTIRFVVVIKSLKNLPTNLRMEKEGVVAHIGSTFFLILLHFQNRSSKIWDHFYSLKRISLHHVVKGDEDETICPLFVHTFCHSKCISFQILVAPIYKYSHTYIAVNMGS